MLSKEIVHIHFMQQKGFLGMVEKIRKAKAQNHSKSTTENSSHRGA